MSALQILADRALVLMSTHGERLGGYGVHDGLAHWSWTRGVWPRGAFEARPGPMTDGIGRLAERFAAADDPIDPPQWHDALEDLHGANRLYRVTTADERAVGLLGVDDKGLWWVQYDGPGADPLSAPLWFEPVPDTSQVGAVCRIRFQPRQTPSPRPPLVGPLAGTLGRLTATSLCRD